MNNEQGPQWQQLGKTRAESASPFSPQAICFEGDQSCNLPLPRAEPQGDNQEEHRDVTAQVWSCSPGNPSSCPLRLTEADRMEQ